MESDDQLRQTAIPYHANIWGYNRNEDSDLDVSSADEPGDLKNLIPSSYTGSGTPAVVNPIRILQPVYGDIIEANLRIKIKLATGEPVSYLRVAIGYFSGFYDPVSSYTQNYINTSHKKITGRAQPFTIPAAGEIEESQINLAADLFKKSDDEFRDDAFVLLLAFDRAPNTGSGYEFTQLSVDCTAQMGLI